VEEVEEGEEGREEEGMMIVAHPQQKQKDILVLLWNRWKKRKKEQ
jgi:hypothetical protein